METEAGLEVEAEAEMVEVEAEMAEEALRFEREVGLEVGVSTHHLHQMNLWRLKLLASPFLFLFFIPHTSFFF